MTLNTAKMRTDQAREAAAAYEKELGIPVVLPLEDSVARLVPVFKSMIEKSKALEAALSAK
ncbi:hypothetical protein D3C83_254930 [compost metagenome]